MIDIRKNMRADLLIVIGMIMVICSLFLPWERYSYVPSATVALGALVSQSLVVFRSGFSIPEKYALISASLFSGLLLLFMPNEKTSKLLCGLLIVCGVVCFAIAIRKLDTLSGVLTGFFGGLALLIGSIERYQVFNTKRKETQNE